MQTELNFIEWLQQIRSPLLDIFFKGLNFFDTTHFFFILIPFLWFGKNWKVGMRLFTIVLINRGVVSILKDFFAAPRPYHLIPKLGVIEVSGHGFPSGGATMAVLLAGLLISYEKRQWKWPVAFAFFFLVSLSRLYLGVHLPRDVFAGWILGLFLWAFFVLAWPPVERFLKRIPLPSLFAISQGVPLLIIICLPSLFSLSILAMGLSLGLFINAHYKLILPQVKTTKESLLRGSIGILTSLFMYGIAHLFSLPSSKIYLTTQLLLVGLGISLLGTWICLKCLYKKTR